MKTFSFNPFIYFIVFLFCSCAVTTPKENFYASNIKTIEINLAERQYQYKDQNRANLFLKKIQKELGNKGYVSTVGSKNVPAFLGDIPSSLDDYTKTISTEFNTDAILYLDCNFLRYNTMVYTRGQGDDKEIIPSSMLGTFVMYNKEGERLLQSTTMNEWKFIFVGDDGKQYIYDDMHIENLAKELLGPLPPYDTTQEGGKK